MSQKGLTLAAALGDVALNVPCADDGSAILPLAKRRAAAARSELLSGVQALEVTRVLDGTSLVATRAERSGTSLQAGAAAMFMAASVAGRLGRRRGGLGGSLVSVGGLASTAYRPE